MFLGLKRERWNLKGRTISNVEIDEDLQLVLIGVVNKTLDVVVQAVLEHMACLYNTLWMIQPGVGATMQDTQIKNEMAKPWVAINAFWRRWRMVGFFGRGSICRLVVTLTISVSVMLLGAGLNTVGWAKKRWYPDHGREMNLTEHSSNDLTIHTPLMSIDYVNWAEDMRAGLALVGGTPKLDEDGEPVLTGGAADEIAGAIAASTAFFALTRLPGVYNKSPTDWLPIWDTPGYITGMQTQINGSTVQTVSVQSPHIIDLFNYQKEHGKPFASTATGFHAILQMTAPQLTTNCVEPVADGPPDNGLEIRQPDGNSATFSVLIGPSAGLGFAGAACTLTVSQVFVPVETWRVDMGSLWMSVHNITAPVVPRSLPIATAQSDALIAARLATHFTSMMPMLHGQVPSFGVVPHLAMAGRTLQAQHPSFTSDVAALAPIVATLAQQQLSTASWALRAHTETLIPSAPVHWQLYGSGPRMKWEWITMAVLVILFIVMANHVLLLVVYRIQPGSWLEMGGMLRTAHKTSGPLSSVDKVYGTSSLSERNDLAKRADDGIRYEVVDVRSQWPKLVEIPIAGDWNTKKRRARHKQTHSTTSMTQLGATGRPTSNTMPPNTPPGASPSTATALSSTPPSPSTATPRASTPLSNDTSPVTSVAPTAPIIPTLVLPNASTSSLPSTSDNSQATQNPSPAVSTTALLDSPST